MIKVPNLNNSKLKYGNFPLFGGVGSLSIYKANRLRPELLSDFTDGSYYSTNSSSSTTFSDLITHARASNGTYIDADGNLQTAGTNEPRVGHHLWDGSEWVNAGLLHESESRTNLLLNSASLETQTVAVTPDEPHTISFYSGETVVDLDESIAATAVDVFVYDTSKDSDGGAWRTGALAQASSWYNETLNTATRGSRREFPAVAVIVLTGGGATIYDGDDPSLPMWMTFNDRYGDLLSQNGNQNAVFALNGFVFFAGAGLQYANFISDSGGAYQTTGQADYLGNLSERSSLKGFSSFSGVSDGVINNVINDVAMTVLPDAPIDPATGLPVPTILCGTDGNGTYSTSIITDSGDVYDIASDSTGTAVSVAFDGVSAIVTRSDGTVYVWDDAGDIAADGASPNATYSASSTPALLGTVSEVAA